MLRFLNGKSKTITGAAIVLATASFLSRFVGIIRERIFAHMFGAGDVMDAYVAAFRLPDLLYMLLVMGALSAGFIPVFSELWEKNKEKAWELVNTILNLLLLVLAGVSIVLIILAPALTDFIAPGFSPEKKELTTTMMRIMFVSPIILGASAIVSGVLQTFRHFVIYALTPILYNIGIIIGAWLLAPTMGPKGLAVGVLLGAVLHLAAQLPLVFASGFRIRMRMQLKMKELHEIIRLMIPRALGLGATQLNIIVLTMFASTLSSGAVAIFHYANNLQSFPIGIIGVSIGIAAFPTLCALVAKGQIEEMVAHVNRSIRTILFLMIPITVLFILLRAQITRILLGTGAFDWNATIQTYNTLTFFALSLFAQALLPIFQRAFYALHNTKTPLKAALIGILINIAIAWWAKDHGLLGIHGIAAVALSFSIGVVIQLAVLWVALRRTIGTLHEDVILVSLYKCAAAALIMGLVVQMTKYWIGVGLGTRTFWAVFTQGVVPASIGALVYGFLLYLMQSQEALAFLQGIRKKFLKPKVLADELPESASSNE